MTLQLWSLGIIATTEIKHVTKETQDSNEKGTI
jgi:hypothetical protein